MKKVLALVLAVMMMATVAFATTVSGDSDGFIVNPGSDAPSDQEPGVLPGKSIKVTALSVAEKTKNDDVPYRFADSGNFTGDVAYDPSRPNENKLLKDFNSSNYTITAVKYNDGKNLVKSVTFNDKEDRVEIKLNDNFDLTKEKKLDMTFVLKGKKSGKTKPADVRIRIQDGINYKREYLPVSLDNELKLGVMDFKENRVYEIEESDETDVNDRHATYGTMEFTSAADDDVDVEVRVYDGERYYLYNNTDADTDVLKKYTDTDADLTFLNFKGTPTFNATATVRLYKEEGTYFYVNTGDGKLVDINGRNAGGALDTTSKVKWDEDEGCYILKTRTLGKYVFSDKKLDVSATADTETKNPDTGANDVVGIATALAAVALVSAAAVSLKK